MWRMAVAPAATLCAEFALRLGLGPCFTTIDPIGRPSGRGQEQACPHHPGSIRKTLGITSADEGCAVEADGVRFSARALYWGPRPDCHGVRLHGGARPVFFALQRIELSNRIDTELHRGAVDRDASEVIRPDHLDVADTDDSDLA